MRVLLSTYGSRGDVEPMLGFAAQPGAPGAEAWVCAPTDSAELPAGVGVPLVTIGQHVCLPVTGATPPAAADLPPRAAESPPGSTPPPRGPKNVVRRSRSA